MSINTIHLKYIVILRDIETSKDAFSLSVQLLFVLYLTVIDICDNVQGKSVLRRYGFKDKIITVTCSDFNMLKRPFNVYLPSKKIEV